MKLDTCFAVCYTGYRDRYPRLMKELDRVGVSPTVVWNFPSPYDDFVRKRIPCIPELNRKPAYFSAGVGQYRALKTAYELGHEAALIVEDDCRFLKDLDVVRSTLRNAPPDWDILLLDHFLSAHGEPKDGWAPCWKARSTACHIVNRKAMERLIDMHESPVNGRWTNPMMRICDHWLDTRYMKRDCRIYCAVPRLAVQCRCGPSTSGPGGTACHYGRDFDWDRYEEY